MSVEYNRLLRMETQIANSVVKRMMGNDGLYLPPDFILGRYIFFAVDNVDFAEDTPDGKRTLHGTAMAIYQRCHDGDETTKLELDEPSGERSLKELPSTVTMLLDCPKPAAQPPTTTYSTFRTKEEQQHITEALLPDAAWLLGRSLVKVSSRRNSQLIKRPPKKTFRPGLGIILLLATIYLQPGLVRHHCLLLQHTNGKRC